MRTASLHIKVVNIAIHNLYSGLELTSPVYCNNGATCHVPPSQQIDAGNTMVVSFGMNSRQEDFKGALLYKMQRKYSTRTGNQPNNSTTSIEDIPKNIYLLVVWDVKNYYNSFHIYLIEYTDDFTWDEDKLWALFREYNEQFRKDYQFNINAWLLHDGTVMKTRLDITYGFDYKVDIVMSEDAGKYLMAKPIKIAPKRLVLSSPILITLIYILLVFPFDHLLNWIFITSA
jgi:hypothetical protein